MTDTPFFEEDEPIEKIRAAWDSSEKGVTGIAFTIVEDSRDFSGTDTSMATDWVGHVSEREVPVPQAS